MSAPAPFDVFECGLDRVNLIEASAGTGKTWSICVLVLRLLLERALEVRQILVVTFTNAATAQLRERVRSAIAETLAWLRAGPDASAPADGFAARLVQAVERHAAVARPQMANLLDQALQAFDEAAILTIHGFCQRALSDASFSAALPFTLELITDDREMALQAVQDFWRNRIAGNSCPPALAAYLVQCGDTPDRYAQLLARSLAKPLARNRWPSAIDREPALDLKAVTRAFEAARTTWAAQRERILDLLAGAGEALHRGRYSAAGIAQAGREWDAWLQQASPLPRPDGSGRLEMMSSVRLVASTKKSRITPVHPFFEQARDLLAASDAVYAGLELARLRLIRDLIEMAGAGLRRHKRERRVISFDDMLQNLHAALESAEHPGLAGSLRQRFPVALIDEFQDTDPLQFAIFDRIYCRAGGPAFFVGDPKQAIYSFRHADLHAYLRARGRADATWTLAQNQRSTQDLIDGLNALFSATPDAFMLPGLSYHDVSMGSRPRPPFHDGSERRSDLQVWMLPDGDGERLDKREARARSLQATAAEIARLLTEGRAGRIRIDAAPLKPADIAVMVRTHAQGTELKRELAALNVGSVELTQASVFATSEAGEVERVLIAINEPAREPLLRAALATELMGFDAARLAHLALREDGLLEHLERFADYRQAWLRQGVGVMVRRLLADYQVSSRMLRLPDGERRLTNLLHLGEQIHQAAAAHESPDALLRWLHAQRSEGSIDEVAQLRLESDRNLVHIVTIHSAKGLEYPVVFCPLLWDGRTQFGAAPLEGREYHDGNGDAVIDWRSDADAGAELVAIEAQIGLERAAELLRLIYVAMTRAIVRCYLVAGCYTIGRSGAESARSLLNWLVCGRGMAPDQWLGSGRDIDSISAAWQALGRRLRPKIDVAALPQGPGTPVAPEAAAPESLTALALVSAIASPWRVSSFTGLALDARSEAAATDHDGRVAEGAATAAGPAGLAPDDILRFPRGPRAGECLHAMFERADFTQPDGWHDAVARALSAHPPARPQAAAASALADMALRMLRDVTAARLPDGLVLGTVTPDRRLAELEFDLPAPRLSAGALNATLQSLGYDVPRLAFNDLRGYLKGFIDLVFEHAGRFYVLDWKSNHLGYTASDYAAAPIAASMAAHAYHLQYLLYTLAVDRYLKLRVPGYRYETHFGGVLYLFVRGVRPDWVDADGAPAGVFHHRPDAAAIARLQRLFSRAAGQMELL
jgi:exodeoxyribonuclease V beta subunit